MHDARTDAPEQGDLRSLTPLHLDALREVANMGAGHAATALSELTSRVIGMEVPEVSVVPATSVEEVLGEAEGPLTAVLMDVLGELNGRIVQVFPGPTAVRLTSIVLSEPALVATTQLRERHYRELQEIGKTLVAAYLNAVSMLLGQVLSASPPTVQTGAPRGLLGRLVQEASPGAEFVVCVNARLLIGADRLRAHLLLIPDHASLAVLFRLLRWQT
jgi:chemotaxis protein CheC